MAIQFITRETCPVCGNENSKTLYRSPFSEPSLQQFVTQFYRNRIDLKQLTDAIYQIDQCRNCRFIYQSNIFNEAAMAALYGDWIDAQQSLHKKQNAKPRLFRQYAGQIQTLSKLFPILPNQVKVLEYGMGWGYWSRMAQAFGYQVSGLELSTQRADYARSMGLDVIDKLPAPTPNYHFIIANQVFEHLPNPLETLQQLTARLRSDGIIYLRVPDGRGIEKILRQSGWAPELNAIHPLEHINCFTRHSLVQLASRAGLVVCHPPLRLCWGSLPGGIKREFFDRLVTTHIYLKNRGGPCV